MVLAQLASLLKPLLPAPHLVDNEQSGMAKPTARTMGSTHPSQTGGAEQPEVEVEWEAARPPYIHVRLAVASLTQLTR